MYMSDHPNFLITLPNHKSLSFFLSNQGRKTWCHVLDDIFKSFIAYRVISILFKFALTLLCFIQRDVTITFLISIQENR